MFILSKEPIQPSQLSKTSTGNGNGALVTFEGIVRRDKYQASEVTSLLYIADESSCTDEGIKIIEETISKFSLTGVICAQRIGQVHAGETAIWIGVYSKHRDDAFRGCRYIIEEVKKRLLIWKKEFMADGSSGWVKGEGTPIV